MKTTIDIADNLLERIKLLSRREDVTIRQLVEEGLDFVLRTHESATKYHVMPVTFKGNGLSPEFEHASWGTIRDAAYEDHGS